MRHLFVKEHKDRKERKLMKLVKKMQQEEDETWYVEQQRRLEQEERDEALARELQEQMAYESSVYTDASYTICNGPYSPMVGSAVPDSPITSSPPPLPAKPTAYYSGMDQPYRQATPLSFSNTSSPSLSQRGLPPPQYPNGQPPLPPRERTVSQRSHYSNPLPQPDTLPATSYSSQRRDPAMLIIPQENHSDSNNPYYVSSTMPMPEPVQPLQYSSTPPYDAPSYLNQPMHMPTPPASCSSYYTLSDTSIGSIRPTGQQQLMKPDDASVEDQNNSITYQHANTPITDSTLIDQPPITTPRPAAASPATTAPTNGNTERLEESDDDDDDTGWMFWECNDGRMMASPTKDDHKGKQLASNDDKDDTAILDITKGDQVIHNGCSNNKDGDPFADSFAVQLTTHDPSEHAHGLHMASVHDPLLTTKQPHQHTDNDLISLNDGDTQQMMPTNVLRAGAPPNIQLIRDQVTAEVPSHEFGYFQHQTSSSESEKEEVDDALMKSLPNLPKAHPDHRHITVPSVVENERVWIRVHPTDTGKSLASRIHIVATYKSLDILSIKTDKGRSIPLDDTPVFQDWAGVIELEDGAPWVVEWATIDNNPWEGPKELLKHLKHSMRLCHD